MSPPNQGAAYLNLNYIVYIKLKMICFYETGLICVMQNFILFNKELLQDTFVLCLAD